MPCRWRAPESKLSAGWIGVALTIAAALVGGITHIAQIDARVDASKAEWKQELKHLEQEFRQELKHLEHLQQLLTEEFRRDLDRLERDSRGDPGGGSPTSRKKQRQ